MMTKYQMEKIVDHMKKKKVGALGEALVLKHLSNKGFAHIESNFLRRQGEIDLIMSYGGKIHFIEVKTVSRVNFRPELAISRPAEVIRKGSKSNVNRETFNHSPEENVTPWKMKKLAKVVQIYLSEHSLHHRDWQFDVVVVYLDMKNKKAYIKIIKDIVLGA